MNFFDRLMSLQFTWRDAVDVLLVAGGDAVRQILGRVFVRHRRHHVA